MEREMTAEERAELVAQITVRPAAGTVVPMVWGTMYFGLGSYVLLTGAAVGIAKLFHQPVASHARTLGIAGTAIVLGWIYLDAFWIRRQRLARLRSLKNDLSHGRIEETRAEVTRLHRFQEPEHFTELLVLTCTDDRLRAVLDDSTFGDSPGRSTLKLGREMIALRFPVSGTELTRFTGAPLRRPKAVSSNPTTWPEEGWITPETLARIDGARL